MNTGPRNLLIEVGTEELPPLALAELSQAFERGLLKALEAAGLTATKSVRYATPRRLAVCLHGVPERQTDRPIERKGPALSAAFDDDGAATSAAKGFARSCGVTVEQLETLNNENGSWLLYRELKPGKSTAEIVPGILPRILTDLPAPKRMRWGSGSAEFVRPVHWLLILYGTEALSCEVFGVHADRLTCGHRFLCPQPISITSTEFYASELRGKGYVLPGFEERRERIRAEVIKCAASVGGRAVIDPTLLDEVTALVEWPVCLVGSFDKRYLETPREALVSTMENHQKYFPVIGEEDDLLPHFVAVSNLESRNPEEVRRGNERVIRPRFADAEFFWNQDRKKTLASRRADLDRVIYEKRLGSLLDKSRRVAKLASQIAAEIGADAALAQRSGELCKCDLLTAMVYEFPELQGVMGRYYAESDGEDGSVASAIEQHYLPRFAGDALPASPLGQALALAERVDTLAATFAVGKQPSGAKDPYGLRRAGLAILRILIESRLPLDLRALLARGIEQLPDELRRQDRLEDLFQFVMERLRTYYIDTGIPADVFEAVAACHTTEPLDFHRRVQALDSFARLEACSGLAAANKRIRNILRRADPPTENRFSEALLDSEAESGLARAIAELESEVSSLIDKRDYRGTLNRLAALRDPVDRFFDEVMVMVDEAPVRNNRLALLHKLQTLFLRVADISRLQFSG